MMGVHPSVFKREDRDISGPEKNLIKPGSNIDNYGQLLTYFYFVFLSFLLNNTILWYILAKSRVLRPGSE